MTVKIIQADESHAAVIASIGKRSFHDTFERYFNKKQDLLKYLEYTYNSEKIELSLAKSENVYYLAFIDDLPVGFAKVKRSSIHSQISSTDQMELQKLYVLCKYHGSGAGRALMNAVLDMVRRVQPDFLWLDVLTANTKAIHFYERRGFIRAGAYPFRIGSQHFDYHLMSLRVAITQPQPC